MYKNVGKKIKKIATFMGYLSFVIAVIGYIVSFCNYDSSDYFFDTFLYWVGPIITPAILLLASFPLYGFGQQVDQLNDFHHKNFNNVSVNSDELPEL